MKAGGYWERRVAEFLEQRGYRVIERNWRTRGGELDLICQHGDTLVFVEVRYRRKGGLTDAGVSVTREKLRRLRRSALAYIASRGLSFDVVWRLDAVLVDGCDIRIVENVTG